MDRARIEQMIAEERPHVSQESALAAVRAANPDWPEAELVVEAESLTQFIPAAALAVLLGNGDWDASLAALDDQVLAGIPVWVVRGEPASGSLTPDATVTRLAALAGPDHVLTIADGPHSPQRTHIAATTLAILRALGVA
jgi:pimeloyl-ACP methyl ester carboxylesterase